jgi:hypothetical protein
VNHKEEGHTFTQGGTELMADTTEFQNIFERLKKILQKFEKRMVLNANEPENYCLYTAHIGPNKKETFFGAVQVKKNYVSYHLMPVYVFPELLGGMSAALKKRMQGKSCFNFTTVDDKLFRDLAELTKGGFEQFKEAGLLK